MIGWHPNFSGLHEISASSPWISPAFVPKNFMLLLSHISRVLLLRPHYFVIRSPGLLVSTFLWAQSSIFGEPRHFQDFIPKRGQHTPYESQSRRACEKLGHCQPWWMDMRQIGKPNALKPPTLIDLPCLVTYWRWFIIGFSILNMG